MAELEIASRSIRESPNVLLLELEGGIDAKSYPVLEEALAQVQKDGCCRLVLKLAGVRFMNEAERLLTYDAAFRKAGGGLVLYEVPAKLRVLFGTLELDKKLAIRGSIDDAIAALVGGQPVDRRKRSTSVADDRRTPREGERRALRDGSAASAPDGNAAPSATRSASPDGVTPAKAVANKSPSATAAKAARAGTGSAKSAKPAASGKSAAGGTARPGVAKPASASPREGATRPAKSSSGAASRAPAAASKAEPASGRWGPIPALVILGLAGAAYVAYAFLFAV